MPLIPILDIHISWEIHNDAIKEYRPGWISQNGLWTPWPEPTYRYRTDTGYLVIRRCSTCHNVQSRGHKTCGQIGCHGGIEMVYLDALQPTKSLF